MDIIYLFQVIERKSVCVVSGITRFFGAWGEKSQWPPVTESMDLKKSQSVTEFPFIWLSNLGFVEHRRSFFLIYNSNFASNCYAPWTVPSGVATTLSPSPTYIPVCSNSSVSGTVMV